MRCFLLLLSVCLSKSVCAVNSHEREKAKCVYRPGKKIWVLRVESFLLQHFRPQHGYTFHLSFSHNPEKCWMHPQILCLLSSSLITPSTSSQHPRKKKTKTKKNLCQFPFLAWSGKRIIKLSSLLETLVTVYYMSTMTFSHFHPLTFSHIPSLSH